LSSVREADKLPLTTLQPNGSFKYQSPAGGLGNESIYERGERERYWRSLGRKIRNRSRIPDGQLRARHAREA